MALAYVGAALANLLFLKGIALHLSVAAFGLVAVGLTLMLSVSFTTMALRAGSAADAAVRVATGGLGGLAERFDRLAVRIVIGALVCALLFRFIPLSRWLYLPSPWVSAIAPLLAAAALLQGHATGSVLGSGRDRAFAVLIVLDPVLRCALAALFGYLDFGVDGLGPIVAVLASMTVTTVLARSWLPREKGEGTSTRRRRRSLRTPVATPSALAALTAFGLLTFLDVALVRQVLPADESAHFAAISVASRFLVLLPFPLALLLVARVRQRLLRREQPLVELLRMLGIVFIAFGVAALVIYETGTSILGLVLDADKYGHLRTQYFSYAIAASVFGAAELLVFFGIALGRVSLVLLPPVVLMIEWSEMIQRGKTCADCVTIVQRMSVLNLGMLAVVVLLPLVWTRTRRTE